MSEQFATYINVLKVSALVFFASILIIYCMAQYVRSVVVHGGEMPEEAVAKNLTLPGHVYPRQ